MSVAASDQSLYQIVSGVAPATIDDVLKMMESIDQLLARWGWVEVVQPALHDGDEGGRLTTSGGWVEGCRLAASIGCDFCGALFQSGG